ncbi:SRPBCC domain-containing protein [Massilia sp. PAMC28688]|uniref:SRPBCC domain-containing protein n=1 Tax=Massilia sp. PAMC28688 TaxID=2861283 RepID=UPI001C6307CE|nr:SRPBCC domain-containing protein [Massilia sp. PAMC28688]QYF91960.1 SRPBCC domain-containing protein [Massilia sp. PAMC28688]
MIDTEINPDARLWPFSRWYPVIAGAVTGLILRIGLFNDAPGEMMSAMAAAFIYAGPLAISAVAVYVAERQARRSWKYYAWLGSRANGWAVLAALAVTIEGLICAIVIVPLFMVIGAAGGLAMGAICQRTNWPRSSVYGFAALPLILAVVLPAGAGDTHIGHSMRSVVIKAPAAQVWHELHNAAAIEADEVDRAWMYRIGVPLPESGVTRQVGETLVRDVRMGKSIHFAQVASEWRENSYVKWHYRFEPDSIPAGALDDHVKIGGHYFDVVDTIYTLTPKGDATELTISMHYRVSTQFNWYATRVADLLFNNFEKVILEFYARRAEAAFTRASSLPAPHPASAGLPRQAALPRT